MKKSLCQLQHNILRWLSVREAVTQIWGRWLGGLRHCN